MARSYLPWAIGALLLGGTVLGGALCLARPTPRPPSEGLGARAERVGPGRFELSWRWLEGARAVRIAVAPEPMADGGGDEPPMPVRRVKLDASETEHTLRLAPGAHAFVQVAAELPGGATSETLGLHDPVPPSQQLGEPLREAHLVAPDVLQVVTSRHASDDLPEGDWSVERHDGGDLPVEAVHRHSVPVAQPDYELGFGADHDPSVVVVDDRFYLRLAEPVGEREVLRVRGPGEIDALIPFSDRRLATPVVQLNQVGYHPDARARWAYVSWWMGDGGPLSLDGFPAEVEVLRVQGDAAAEVVATLPLAPRAERDDDAGAEVRQIDLAELPPSGEARYRIRIPGVGVSWPTRVDEGAVGEAFRVLARGLYHNRWAGDLDEAHTKWPRPVDHETVFTGEQQDAFTMYPEDTPKEGERPLRGGHHDAGDFDQRPPHTVVPQLLMRAYELRPSAFDDGALDLPESGNGVPDLLDEALWNVAAWEALQEKDGGVRAGVESFRHPHGIYFAHEDPLPYWTYARSANVTARAAGVFAQAARLLEPFDAERAAGLRRRAERAWQWASEHDASAAFRIYGASELYRLTGEERYRRAFEDLWNGMGKHGVFTRFARDHLTLSDYRGDGRVMPDYLLGYLGAAEHTATLREQATKWLGQYADEVARRTLDSPHAHRNPRPPGSRFGWGQATVMGRYLDPILARMQLGGLDDETRRRYFDALSVGADYVLGANPAGRSWVSGLGARPPRRVLHLDSLAWLSKGRPPIPGLPVYGPTAELPQQPWMRHGREAFHPAFGEHPPLRRYVDLRTFPITAEFSVWETQAPHVEHFAVLSAGPDAGEPE